MRGFSSDVPGPAAGQPDTASPFLRHRPWFITKACVFGGQARACASGGHEHSTASGARLPAPIRRQLRIRRGAAWHAAAEAGAGRSALDRASAQPCLAAGWRYFAYTRHLLLRPAVARAAWHPRRAAGHELARGVLFVEVDAGDKLLVQWARDGTLPTFSRLLREGLVGDSESVDGFFVGATWPSPARAPIGESRHPQLVQLRPAATSSSAVLPLRLRREPFGTSFRVRPPRRRARLPAVGPSKRLNGIQRSSGVPRCQLRVLRQAAAFEADLRGARPASARGGLQRGPRAPSDSSSCATGSSVAPASRQRSRRII